MIPTPYLGSNSDMYTPGLEIKPFRHSENAKFQAGMAETARVSDTFMLKQCQYCRQEWQASEVEF